MVNFGMNSASILGIFLAVAGAGLYFLRSIRPELSRDHDIFFAAVGLLCGLILLFQGWRLDPILQFSQLLLTGSAIFFAVETIRLRGVATEQARRNTPIVDERPVSREYRAELEQLEPYDRDERYENNPRLRGYDDPRSSRSSAYDEDEPRTIRTRRPSSGSSDPYSSKEPTRKRRPRPSSPSTNESYDQWRESPQEGWEETSTRSRRRPTDETIDSRTTKKRRPRPVDESRSGMMDDEPVKGEYVDYQPINDNDLNQGDDAWDQPSAPKSRPEREPKNDNPMRFDY